MTVLLIVLVCLFLFMFSVMGVGLLAIEIAMFVMLDKWEARRQ